MFIKLFLRNSLNIVGATKKYTKLSNNVHSSCLINRIKYLAKSYNTWGENGRHIFTRPQGYQPVVYNLKNSQQQYSTQNPSDEDDEKKRLETRENQQRLLPTLMPFNEIYWPSVIKSIRNWIMIHMIIRPYFDQDFNMPDFTLGARHALQIVSEKISSGDWDGLATLVDSEILPILKESVSAMTMKQRNEIQVINEDIFLSFAYQIGIMFDESNEKIQKRWVEITMVFHIMKGLQQMQDRGERPPLNLNTHPDYRDRLSVCNYRFKKEFTQGCESDWTINVVNHFKPSDYVDE